MKKVILILVMVLGLTAFLKAQYIPTSGFSAEVNFNPLSVSNSPIQLDYLKVRMFINENVAVRLGFQLNSYSEDDKSVYSPGPNQIVQETKSSYFIFGLHPGIEYHIKGTDRLSPYVGAEINFTMKSATSTITNQGVVTGVTEKYDGAWDGTGTTNPAYTMIGLNIICGTDYYVAKHLYLGVEVGLGFGSYSYKDITTTATAGGASTSVTNPGGSNFTLGVTYNSFLRLGWSF